MKEFATLPGPAKVRPLRPKGFAFIVYVAVRLTLIFKTLLLSRSLPFASRRPWVEESKLQKEKAPGREESRKIKARNGFTLRDPNKCLPLLYPS